MRLLDSVLKFLIFIPLFIFVILFQNCGHNDHPEPEYSGIALNLLKTETEAPAKVKIFFQAEYNDGLGVAALDTSNISIYEDDALISIFEADRTFRDDPEDFIFSTLLLLDLSGSVLNAQSLPALKDAATSLINEVLPNGSSGNAEMAIYWFDGEENIHLLNDFSSNAQELINAVNSITENISMDNSTNLNGALVQGIELMNARIENLETKLEILNAGSLLIFTDGTDRASRVTEDFAIKKTDSIVTNLTLFTVGLGGEINNTVLAKFGKDGFEYANNLQNLTNSFKKIADRIKDKANSYYVFEYCSPKRAGSFNLKIDVLKDDKGGSLVSTFSADGFTGGCMIDP
jgi:uncharacterized protein YegL